MCVCVCVSTHTYGWVHDATQLSPVCLRPRSAWTVKGISRSVWDPLRPALGETSGIQPGGHRFELEVWFIDLWLLFKGVGSIVKLGGEGLIMVPRSPQRKDHADASTQL